MKLIRSTLVTLAAAGLLASACKQSTPPAESILFSEVPSFDESSNSPASTSNNPRQTTYSSPPAAYNPLPTADTAGLEKLAEQLRNPPVVSPEEAHRTIRDNIVRIKKKEKKKDFLVKSSPYASTA